MSVRKYGGCPDVVLDKTRLYCHPQELSGPVRKDLIEHIEKILTQGTTFQHLFPYLIQVTAFGTECFKKDTPDSHVMSLVVIREFFLFRQVEELAVRVGAQIRRLSGCRAG